MKNLILMFMIAIMALSAIGSIAHANPLKTIEEAGLRQFNCDYTLIGPNAPSYTDNVILYRDVVISADTKDALKISLQGLRASVSENTLFVTIRFRNFDAPDSEKRYKVKDFFCAEQKQTK